MVSHNTQQPEMRAAVIPITCHDIFSASHKCQFTHKVKDQRFNLLDELCFPGNVAQEGISLLNQSEWMWGILTGETVRNKGYDRLVALNTSTG